MMNITIWIGNAQSVADSFVQYRGYQICLERYNRVSYTYDLC